MPDDITAAQSRILGNASRVDAGDHDTFGRFFESQALRDLRRQRLNRQTVVVTFAGARRNLFVFELADIDLSLYRLGASLLAVGVLLFGFIWQGDEA